MTPCPNDEMLGALVHHGLAAAEHESVTAHIDECALCRAVVVAVVRGGGASAPTLALGTPSLPALAAPGPVPVGARIGRYEVRALLGAGGMGQVFEAYDGELDRAVALKVLRPELARNSVVLAERLLRESRLMAKVVHPAVITVHDVGREGDAVFIAMELVRGETLGAYVARLRPPWREIVALYERAGRGLAAAHAAGIVHRDFKPDNVLVERDAARVIVTDFGIARAAERDDVVVAGTRADIALTSPGAAVGTPAYMAPEQLDGRTVDARADVFAYAVSLWEALFGARPFAGTTPAEIRAAIEQPPRAPRPGVPGRLIRVLERGLARDPAERWPDLQAMVAALAAARTLRRRLAIASGAVGLVGIGIVGALALGRSASVDPCAHGLAALDAAYPRDALRAALDRDPAVRDFVLAKVETASQTWRAAHVATCHADREPAQPPTVTACLDARRIELAGFIADTILDGPAHAKQLAGLIGDYGRCATPAPGMLFARVPENILLRRQVTAVRYRAFDGEVARDRGDFAAALAILQPLVGEAAKTWPPLHAETLYELGAAQSQGGDNQQAEKTLRDAAALAETTHHDYIAANAWIQLALTSTFDQQQNARGLEYVTYAEAALDRIGHPSDISTIVAYVKGATLAAAERPQEAEVEFTRAIELAEHGNPDYLPLAIQGLGFAYEQEGRHREAIAAYRNALAKLPPEGEVSSAIAFRERLASNLSLVGENDEALRLQREAVALADGKLGEDNLDRPIAHGGLAMILEGAGKLDEALLEARAATRGVARLQGERSERYAETLMVEGEILDALERSAEGEPIIARACEIIAFQAGEGSSQELECWTSDANALMRIGKYAAALVLADKAVAGFEVSPGNRSELPNTLTARGLIHGKLHHHAQAVSDFERSIALDQAGVLEPGHVGATEWGLAQELAATDPEHARALADDAIAKLAAPGWAKARAEATAWRKAHP